MVQYTGLGKRVVPRQSQEAGFTERRDHFLAQPCTRNKNVVAQICNYWIVEWAVLDSPFQKWGQLPVMAGYLGEVSAQLPT